MDNYNKLFMIIRKTDLLYEDEKHELKLYLMNLQEQVKKQKEVIDRLIELNQIINNSDYVYSQDEITTKNLDILKEMSE